MSIEALWAVSASSERIGATYLEIIPDIATRDVYVCGPVAMIERVLAALAELGVPRERVHAERFSYL